MNDHFLGFVYHIVDGDTMDVRILQVPRGNSYAYGQTERIRLAGVDTPPLSTPRGRIAKALLARRFLKRVVHCRIHARDVFGRLVCSVTVRKLATAGRR